MNSVLIIALLSMLFAASAPADGIGMNFTDLETTPLMGPTEEAGAPGFEQINWNSDGREVGSLDNLIDASGQATTVSVSWTANSTYRNNNVPDESGNNRMMRGYLDTSDTSTTQVTVTGIPYGNYTLVIYMDGGNYSARRNGKYTVVNPADGSVIAGPYYNQDPPNTTFDGTFIQTPLSSVDDETTPAGNFMIIDDLTVDTFRLEVAGVSASDTDPRGPLSAFQILVGISQSATKPVPANGATDVLRDDTQLSWQPGDFAQTHNVYLGTDFNDVNEADEASPLLVGPDLLDTVFDPDRLILGETYYWRVDEVNDANPESPWKGEVWSFEVEPVAYPLDSNSIVVSASEETEDPNNIINHSGLEFDEVAKVWKHDNEETNMWLASGTETVWVQFDFDQLYRLNKILVWNYNMNAEDTLGYGFNDVNVEYTENGTDWMPFSDVVFDQAPGTPDNTADTTLELNGLLASGIRMTANSNHSTLGLTKKGLSEVQFLYIPVWAREPQPDNGAIGVDPNVTLGWRTGREAASHTITLSTDPETVIDTNDNTYDTTALDLQLGETYTWTITEVNDAETPASWASGLWTFSIADVLVIDDMESYNRSDNLPWMTWADGYEVNGNGSLVGADPMTNYYGPATGLGRGQSLPIWFDNTTVSKSEATRTFAEAVDWTKYGIQGLTVYFLRGPDNTGGGQVYLKINSTKLVYQDPTGLPPGWGGNWTRWNIDLSTVGADLTKVTKFIVGVEGANAKGVLYVDDIQLCKDAPALEEELLTWFEAESGTVTTPFEVLSGDATASGGQFVATIPGSGNSTSAPTDGMVTYSLDIPVEGVYKLAFRIVSESDSTDSLWVQIPGATTNTNNHSSGWVRFNQTGPFSIDWRWLEVHSDDDGGAVVEFSLSAGTHTLKVARREEGILLDAIAVLRVTE